MAKLVAILGSVTPPGRLLRALKAGLEVASAAGDRDSEVIDLGGCRVAFADGRPPDQYGDDTASIVARVQQADVVLLASPVYRATYTGALKNLLDHLPLEALAGKPVGVVAMGATQHHYLGVDWHLRDVLAWFGALVAPNSVYLSSADFEDGEPSERAAREIVSLVDALWRLEKIAPKQGEFIGPRPLAARRD